MDKRQIAIAAVVAVLAVGGVVGAVITGVGPAPGGSDGSDGGNVGNGGDGTETPYEDTVVVESTGTESTSSGEPLDPFSFVIQNITECGDTCREVSATIVNQRNTTAAGVTVRSEIYTGGEQIWQGSSDVGELDANATYTDTKTVELSIVEAYRVQQNDGQIRIETYVVTNNGTYVFKDERDVT